MQLNKPKLGMIVASIATFLFLLGVPLRQIKGPLNFFSTLHSTSSVPLGVDWKQTVLGALFVFIVYFLVGWTAGYIYEKF